MTEDVFSSIDHSHIPFSTASDFGSRASLPLEKGVETFGTSSEPQSVPLSCPKTHPLSLPNKAFDLFAKRGHEKDAPPFGSPFRLSADSELDLFPHPQVILASAIESHTHAMCLERDYLTRTILEIDHPRQEYVSKKFNQKLEESIKTANSNQVLSYVQDAIKILNFGVGIVGGFSILCGSSATGNGAGTLYGIEMTGGGLCSFGSFLLNKFGFEDSKLSSILALGGAFFVYHGGLMGRKALKIGEHLTQYGSSALSLLQSYGLFRETQTKIDLSKFSGELSHLQKHRNLITDQLKEHYKALDISDFTAFFKAAVEIIDNANEINRKIVQRTLKG